MKQQQWVPRVHVLGTSPQARLALAVTHIKNGDYQTALRELQAALNTNPHHADIHLTLAWVYTALDREEEAIEAGRSALKYNPKLEQAYLILAHNYKKMGYVPEALEKCRQAVEIDPKNFYSYLLLGELTFSERLYEESINAFQSALKYNPQLEMAHYKLANIYQQKNQEDKASRRNRSRPANQSSLGSQSNTAGRPILWLDMIMRLRWRSIRKR